MTCCFIDLGVVGSSGKYTYIRHLGSGNQDTTHSLPVLGNVYMSSQKQQARPIHSFRHRYLSVDRTKSVCVLLCVCYCVCVCVCVVCECVCEGVRVCVLCMC